MTGPPTRRSDRRRGWLAAAAFAVAGCACRPPAAPAAPAGRVETGRARSEALGEDIRYRIYLPPDYDAGARRYPTLYLLHGRGDDLSAWARVTPDLDRLIAAGVVPPLIVVMPDAPWGRRASWYVDSHYVNGRPVETALCHDLVGAIDASFRTLALREARSVGGYSMGGYGAIRYALAHRDVFAAALVLSPAVYVPEPPRASSARDHGAFGVGERRYDGATYESLDYPALLARGGGARPLHFFIAVGDDEYANPDPDEAAHDLDFETARLYNSVRRAPGVTAEFRVLDGGHDWNVWRPAFVEGLQDIFRHVRPSPAN